MSHRTRLAVFALVACLVHSQSALAVQVPYSDKVGSAVASLMAYKMSARATDIGTQAIGSAAVANGVAGVVATPQYQTTIQAASTVLTGLVTAAAGIAGAPMWATIAIGAVAAAAIPLAVNGVVSWAFNSDGTVSDPSAAPVDPAASSYSSMSAGGQYWMQAGYMAGSADAAFYAYFRNPASGYCGGGKCNPNQYGDYVEFQVSSTGSCYQSKKFYIQSHVVYHDGTSSDWANAGNFCPGYNASGAPQTCDAGLYSYNSAACATIPLAQGTPAAPAPVQMATAAAGVSDTEKQKPVNYDLLAAIANRTWQATAAATPGAVPYDSSHPITAADVQAWQASNTASYPTVGDVLGSAVNPVTGSVPLTMPGQVSGSTTGTVTGTQTQTTTSTGSTSNFTLSIDWGAFIAPDVTAPTIESILDPLFNLWPSWKNFSFPAHTSTCPTPSFTLPSSVMGGRTVVFDQMCTFLEASNVRPAMQAAFAVAWSILIVFIIMGA
jgi:hypothetical protein